MQINKYQERVIEIGLTKSAKLILPEKDDPRVSLAKRQLIELGYDLLDPEDFQSRESHYAEILEQERFFNKMTEEMFKKNVQDLQEQLTEAYKRIKELSEEVAVQKKELIDLRLQLPQNRVTATEYIDGDSGQQDLETYLQRVRKNEGQ